MEIRVVLYGVGQIGAELGRFLVRQPGFRMVGAVDVDPNKAGRDLGEVLGLGGGVVGLRAPVVADAGPFLARSEARVVVHATSSYLREVYPQIAQAVEAGLNVVSTCEELSFPFRSHPEEAQNLDRLARRYGVRVLGTGVNPGFVMDALPVFLSGACQEVRHIQVSRAINASTRRSAFQKKIGAGLTLPQFQKAVAEKAITGHVGLEQSLAMLASALGWEVEIKVDPAQPVMGQPGQVRGQRQQARALKGGKEVILLDFQASVGATEEYDALAIDGVPPVNLKISPCLHGDAATAAIVVKAIPKLLAVPPGLRTMLDLPLGSGEP